MLKTFLKCEIIYEGQCVKMNKKKKLYIIGDSQQIKENPWMSHHHILVQMH